MNPRSPEKTPEKNQSYAKMELIKTPQIDKEENLYEKLLRASPPRVLFPVANDHSQPDDDNYISESPFGSEENSSSIGKEQAPKLQPAELEKRQEAPSIHDVTPQKPARVSKGCHCEKSKCQKKYCDCYKVGQICSENCACIGCENQHMTANHKKLQKMTELTRSGKGGRELKCNCKNSHCLKNYCQCHNAGRMCSEACNCIQCDNKIDSERGYQGHKRRHLSHIAEWNGESSGKENVLFN